MTETQLFNDQEFRIVLNDSKRFRVDELLEDNSWDEISIKDTYEEAEESLLSASKRREKQTKLKIVPLSVLQQGRWNNSGKYVPHVITSMTRQERYGRGEYDYWITDSVKKERRKCSAEYSLPLKNNEFNSNVLQTIEAKEKELANLRESLQRWTKEELIAYFKVNDNE